MRNIILFFAVMILFLSCKKNEQPVSVSNANSIAGNWSADYLNKSIQVSVTSDNHFSLRVPVIVKKESNAAPVTLDLSLQGVCILNEGGYEFSIKTCEGGALQESRSLIVQSLEGVGVEVLSTGDSKQKKAKLTAVNGKLVMRFTGN